MCLDERLHTFLNLDFKLLINAESIKNSNEEMWQRIDIIPRKSVILNIWIFSVHGIKLIILNCETFIKSLKLTSKFYIIS